jgi:hypothetical protein
LRGKYKENSDKSLNLGLKVLKKKRKKNIKKKKVDQPLKTKVEVGLGVKISMPLLSKKNKI